MDTRRYRSHVEGTDFSTRTMLGDAQLTELYKWLTRVCNNLRQIKRLLIFTT